MIKPNDYLTSRLKEFSLLDSSQSVTGDINEYVFRRLTTSKFRRHAMTPGYDEHIKKVIDASIANNDPIPLVWVFGGYKLWRLKEYPLPDWAELFFLFHKVDWLKPILSVYKPGVSFDFFDDGIMVPKLNSIPKTDKEEYEKSFSQLLKFVNDKVPKNLKFTVHKLGSQYPSVDDFQKEYEDNYQKVIDQDKESPLLLSKEQEQVIQMNVKSDKTLTPGELHKNQLMFEAFVLSSMRRPYYRNDTKIFLDSFAIKNCLPIGSTRTSVVRFWIGKGVLRKYKDSFLEEIHSVKQLAEFKYSKYKVKGFENLGKNFESIGVVE